MTYHAILPVLFLEYLSLSLARSLLPAMIIHDFGSYSYFLIGLTESVKGLLSFLFCPLIGKLSDYYGRKNCLLVSMIGTTIPICFLAFSQDMRIYSVLVAISGIFAATFALTFAYISDCVDQKDCAPAFGIALATFGFSFTIGPFLGAHVSSHYDPKFVFRLSNVLVAINCFYITFFLPETVQRRNNEEGVMRGFTDFNIFNAIATFRRNAFISKIAVVVLLYYTAVWAVVSTLMVYVTRQLHVDVLALGSLLSCYGLITMFSEGVLVRILVPRLGEQMCIRIGLLAYATQSFLIAFAPSIEFVYVSLLFSALSNLVYPSICSLVTKVSGDRQGEALGSLNGLKSLTEGLGPLVFGLLMTLFEHHIIPGAPYVIVGFMTLWAYLHTYELGSDLDVLYGKDTEQSIPESVSLLQSKASFDNEL